MIYSDDRLENFREYIMDSNFTNQPPYQQPPRQRPQMSRQQYINKRKRKRKAMMLRILAAFLVIAATVSIIAGAIILLKGRTFSGTYEREIDISDKVCGEIAVWLADIDDTGFEEEIDTDWVKSRTEPYTVREVIVLSDKDSGKDSYKRYIDPDSHSMLTDKVNSDIDKFLTEIIREKLVQKGYKEELSDDETSEIISQVLGTNASDYLSNNGISLIPSVSELSLSIIGTDTEQQGTYIFRGNNIEITAGDSTQTESIMKKKGTLVFTESGKVYNEKQ